MTAPRPWDFGAETRAEPLGLVEQHLLAAALIATLFLALWIHARIKTGRWSGPPPYDC